MASARDKRDAALERAAFACHDWMTRTASTIAAPTLLRACLAAGA